MPFPVPLPEGFEEKFDARTNRHYYINHRAKTTGWVDPRLSHASIWIPPRIELLRSLTQKYNATDSDIRKALLTHAFDRQATESGLQRAGFRATAVERSPTITDDEDDWEDEAAEDNVADLFPRVADAADNGSRAVSASQVSPSINQSNQPSVNQLVVDNIKAKYPTVDPSLHTAPNCSFQGNERRVMDELSEMGCKTAVEIEREAHDERVRREEQEMKTRLQQQRDRIRNEEQQRKQQQSDLSKLFTEFDGFGADRIRSIYQAENHSYEAVANKLMLERTTTALKKEFQDQPLISTELIEKIARTNKGDFQVCQKILREALGSAKEKERKQPSASRAKTPSPKKLRPPTSEETRVKSIHDLRESGDKGDRTAIEVPTLPKAQKPRASSSSSYRGIAVGPQSGLAKGPNNALRCERVAARGADPTARRGPDPALVQHAKWNKPVVAN